MFNRRACAVPKRTVSIASILTVVLISFVMVGCGDSEDRQASPPAVTQSDGEPASTQPDEAPPSTRADDAAPTQPDEIPAAPPSGPSSDPPSAEPSGPTTPAEPGRPTGAEVTAYLVDFLNARGTGGGADRFLSPNAAQLFETASDLSLYPGIESYLISEPIGADASSFEVQVKLVTSDSTITETLGIGPGEAVSGETAPLVVRFAVLDSLEVTAESDPLPVPEPRWTRQPQLPEGEPISVRSFNRFLKNQKPAWASSPLLLAIEFLQLGRPEGAAQTTISVERMGGVSPTSARVEVVTEGLFDDSVAAQRFELALRRTPDGTWRLKTASWAQRCQAGRGQQTFTSAYCV